jgi:hypothetical protein
MKLAGRSGMKKAKVALTILSNPIRGVRADPGQKHDAGGTDDYHPILGPYPGELRRQVIGFVLEQEVPAVTRLNSSRSASGPAIRWMQRFREDGTCEPMPRGGSTSPLEENAHQILALNRERPDYTLDEIVLALQKRRNSWKPQCVGTALLLKKACAPQSESAPTWVGRAAAQRLGERRHFA